MDHLKLGGWLTRTKKSLVQLVKIKKAWWHF